VIVTAAPDAPGVSRHVGDGLGCDEVGRGFAGLVGAPAQADFDAHRHGAAGDQRGQRRVQATLVENRRMDSAHQSLGYLEASSRWPNPGLAWLTDPEPRSLATCAEPLGYVLNLKLADPGGAEAFANRFTAGGSYHDNVGNPSLSPWQEISQQDGLLVRFEQNVLLVGSWLLALLAIGGLAILVGARMADQMRRVGLLKAVGATPELVTGVLLAQYLVLALVAATAGLFIGWLAAPLLTGPGSGLLGTANAPSLTIFTVVIVVAVALAVAILATLVPALHGARTSTVRALADAPRQPRRHRERHLHHPGDSAGLKAPFGRDPRARRYPSAARRRTLGGASVPGTGRRHCRYRRRFWALRRRREPRRERQPAADVVADCRDRGDRDHRGRAHRHSCPPWCSPSGGADPPIRGGVKPSRRYATARASSGRVKEGSLLRPDDGEVIGI
jgi:hypothetical protein